MCASFAPDNDSLPGKLVLNRTITLKDTWAKNVRISDMEYRIGSRGGLPGGKSPDDLVTANALRIGIEKRGDSFALFVSLQGEPMHQFGAPVTLKINGPFYAGIGFCSHLPDKSDTAVFSNVVIENSVGKVH